MRQLNAEILAEAREVTGRKSLRQKDIMEWSTSREQVETNLADGEDLVRLPMMGIWAAIVRKPVKGAGKGSEVTDVAD